MTGLALRPRASWAAHLLVAGLALALLALCTLLALDGLAAGEERTFRLVNDVPLPVLLVWPVMQLGNVLAVPTAALAAAALRRWRLSLELLLAGAAAYVLAKVVKEQVDRGRPGELLDDVQLRGAGDSGRGFVSGHAAVVVALALVAWPHLGPRGRRAVVVCAVLVALARVWVGAHLPLDVVGGAALGVAVAAVVLLLRVVPPVRSRTGA